MFQREADQGDEVGEPAGLRAAFDLAGSGGGEGLPKAVFGPRGVVVAQFLFQFLEHRLGEALLVRAAVKDLQRGDLGFVLLDVVTEGGGKLGARLRAFLRRAGVKQRVAGNDVNGLIGGLGDFLEQVAEIGIRGERSEGGFDTDFTDWRGEGVLWSGGLEGRPTILFQHP